MSGRSSKADAPVMSMNASTPAASTTTAAAAAAAHLSGRYASRADLLGWINTSVRGADVTKVEALQTGVVYAHMVAKVLEHTTGTVSAGTGLISKIKLRAATEYDNLHNFKVVQEGLARIGVTAPIQDLEKVIRGNHQANLQFLQWFCRHFVQHGYHVSTEVDLSAAVDNSAAAAARSGDVGSRRSPSSCSSVRRGRSPQRDGRGGDATPMSRERSTSRSRADGPALSVAPPRARSPMASRGPVKGFRCAPAGAAGDAIALERQFFYDKLRAIELLLADENRVAEMSSAELAAGVRGILFSAE